MDVQAIVDVVIAAYNHEHYIAQCLDSVLSQETDFKFRILIGDDHSTDRTPEIIKNYLAKYPDIIVPFFRERNTFNDPRRNGILLLEQATSKYIALLDGDDYWVDPSKLQTQITFLEQNPDFAICFHKDLLLKNGQIEANTLNINQEQITSFSDLAVLGNYIPTASCVFRNNPSVPDIMSGHFSRCIVGDWIMNLLNAQNGKVKFIDTAMSVYRVHGNGIWSNRDIFAHSLGLVEAVKLARNYFDEKERPYFEQHIARLYTRMCFLYFENGDHQNFRKNFIEVLKVKKFLSSRTLAALRIRNYMSQVPSVARAYNRLRQIK